MTGMSASNPFVSPFVLNTCLNPFTWFTAPSKAIARIANEIFTTDIMSHVCISYCPYSPRTENEIAAQNADINNVKIMLYATGLFLIFSVTHFSPQSKNLNTATATTEIARQQFLVYHSTATATRPLSVGVRLLAPHIKSHASSPNNIVHVGANCIRPQCRYVNPMAIILFSVLLLPPFTLLILSLMALSSALLSV